MTIGAHELELIKKEVAGIREFYSARLDADIPPIRACPKSGVEGSR